MNGQRLDEYSIEAANFDDRDDWVYLYDVVRMKLVIILNTI